MISRDQFLKIFSSGDLKKIQQAVKNFLCENSGLANQAFIARKIKEFVKNIDFPTKRVSILASFNIDLLESSLVISEFLEGRELIFHTISYKQWYEALTKKGQLDIFEPDVVFLLLHLEDIAPKLANNHLVAAIDLDKELELVEEEINKAVEIYRSRANAPVFLSSFIAKRRGIEKHFDLMVKPSRQEYINRLNTNIGKIAQKNIGFYIFDYAQTVIDNGRNNWFDIVRGHHVGVSISPSAMPKLANDLSEVLTALWEPRHKLIAIDLDNTLWGGIVGEDGVDGISVGGDYPGNAFLEFQSYLSNLRASGIILAIVSKNNYNDANEVFQFYADLPLSWNDFSVHKINWNDKASNILDIGKELSLGVNSFVFVDDMPIERDLVRKIIPEVTVVELDNNPCNYINNIMSQSNFYSLSLTEEDQVRVGSYSGERERNLQKQSLSSDDFLNSLDLKLTIRHPKNSEFERVLQLLEKTNQFNLTTKRYDFSALEKFRKDNTSLLWVVRLTDRYGEYGIVGVAITIDQENNTREIDTLLFSCRALGRQVEEAFLSEIETQANNSGLNKVIGFYSPTKKNIIVADFYPANGYIAGKEKGYYEKELNVNSIVKVSKHIKIIREKEVL
jgi:FkbH-like protein